MLIAIALIPMFFNYLKNKIFSFVNKSSLVLDAGCGAHNMLMCNKNLKKFFFFR